MSMTTAPPGKPCQTGLTWEGLKIILYYPRMMPALSDAVDVYDDSISGQAVHPLLMTASELSAVKL